MKAVVALFEIILAGVASTTAAQSPRSVCLRYEPDTVRISGTLTRHMYYGAPGYGEDPKHDEKEVGFYLDLRSPLCMMRGRDDLNVPRNGIRRVQLALRDQSDFDRLRPFLGKRVTIRGSLFAAVTGHHHTPVLLNVVEPAHVELGATP